LPVRTRFDAVFFSFWLSHVPRARLTQSWALVGSLLTTDGRVFLIDNRRDPTRHRPDPDVVDEAARVQLGRLNDGTEHRVVEAFHEPDEPRSLLATEGCQAEITGTRWFIYGSAAPGRNAP
jgi:hypothetical protein